MPKNFNWGNSVWPKAVEPKNFAQAELNKQLALSALQTGVSLSLIYDGLHRIVEVHTVGITNAGRPAMSAYQVDGQSNTPLIPDWRLFCFDKSFDVAFTTVKASSPRTGYKRGAKQFRRIDAEI